MLITAAVVNVIGDLVHLIIGDYKIDPSQTTRVNEFSLQGKANHIRSVKSTSQGYSFSSSDGYYFSITGAAYYGVTDKKELGELLTHHGLHFIAFSDSSIAEEFKNTKKPIGISLSQIQIGDKKFIDANLGNSIFRNRIWVQITLNLLAVIIVIFWGFKRLLRKE